MTRALELRIGPVAFELRSSHVPTLAAAAALYRDYPAGHRDGICDFLAEAAAPNWARKYIRRSLVSRGDYEVEGAVPLPVHMGLLVLEMAMNLQMALGYRRGLLFHAASSIRDGCALLIEGDSGRGKSTLAATLAYARENWRHGGDEFALVSLGKKREVLAFPRPISLKNASIDIMESLAPQERFGPLLTGTPKGKIRHLLPPQTDIETMDEPARLGLIVSAHFSPGSETRAVKMGESEAYTRLSVASTNQVRLGEQGFDALVDIVRAVPAFDIYYGSTEKAHEIVGNLWAEHVR